MVLIIFLSNLLSRYEPLSLSLISTEKLYNCRNINHESHEPRISNPEATSYNTSCVRIPRILFFLLLSRIIKRDSTPRSLDFKREPHVTDDLLSSKFRTINYQFVKVFIEQSVLEKKSELRKRTFVRAFYVRGSKDPRVEIRFDKVLLTSQWRIKKGRRGTRRKRYDRLQQKSVGMKF